MKWKAAFMGWYPNDPNHKLGRKFAEGIAPGDIILIGHRHNGTPSQVSFGMVVGRYRTRLSGFNPIKEFGDEFGSLRRLSPFFALSRVPKHLPFHEALNPIAAMHQLHPNTVPAHKILCDWMDKKLAMIEIDIATNRSPPRSLGVELRSRPKDHQLEYQTRSRSAVRHARRFEAELVARYGRWIERQDRVLKIFKTHAIECDAYEEDRKNLVEAKCSARREYVRMAVGQLLDYAFHAQSDLGYCHMAILLPSKPEDKVSTWLNSIDICVIWE